MIHAVHSALASVQFLYKVASASAEASDDIVLETGLIHTAHPLDIRGGAARVTHIDQYFFYVCVLHGYMLADCVVMR